MLALGLVCVTCATASADDGSTSRHLLAGVRAFREARYEEALVELRVVAHAPDAPSDLAYYLGPTLYKLGRYREALGVFVASPAADDALTDLYLGETYYQLRMYRKARAIFSRLRVRGMGPVLDEAAGRYVDAIDLVYATPPSDAAIDAYLEEASAIAPKDPLIAGEWLDEARQVEALARPRHRHDEIAASLGAVWNAAHRPGAVIEALGGDPAPGAEGAWQLARAYVATRDLGRARAALAAIASQPSAHAGEARAQLAQLPP